MESRTGKTLIKLNHIIFFRITPESLILSERQGGGVVDILERETLAKLWSLWNIHGAVYTDRFEAGHIPWGAWLEDNLAHVAWTAYGSLVIDELAKVVLFSNTTTIVYDVFTREQYRGHGLFTRTLSEIARSHFDKGSEEVVIYAERHNIPSQTSIRNAGGIECASSICFQLGKIRLTLKSPRTICNHVETL